MGVTAVEAQQKKTKKEKKAKSKGEELVDAEVEPSKVEDEGEKKKGKKKRAKEYEEDANDAKNKAKRNKKKHAADEDGEPTDYARVLAEDNTTDVRHKEEKKKRRVKEIADGEGEVETKIEVDAVEVEGKKNEKKDRKKGREREERTATAAEDNKEGSSEKKSKKRKDRKVEDSQEVTEEETKPKKRRKHSKSGFPDPDEDGVLSEQAKKALSYAYIQAEDPSSWKFNKARQNWLLRNVWSEEAIPDVHVLLVNKYLSGVQGGVRETLIKTCREVLAAKPTEEPKPQPVVEPAAADSNDKLVETKVKVKFDTPAEDSAVTATLELRQARARKLLEVLTGEKM